MTAFHHLPRNETSRFSFDNTLFRNNSPTISFFPFEKKSFVLRRSRRIKNWMRNVILYRYNCCRFYSQIQFSDIATNPDQDHFNISVVTIGSSNRIISMPLFAGRWDGPIIYVIYLKEHEVALFNSFLLLPGNSILCSPRIQIFTFVVSPPSYLYKNYPINILRNIGIQHVQTSHFIALDIDMLLNHSYQVLMDLPSEVTQDPIAAVVIPSFFHSGWKVQNGTFEEQVKSVMHRIPFTIDELIKCQKKSKCHTYKPLSFTHVYIPYNWLYHHSKKIAPKVYIYKCWKNVYQEPYLLVKRDDRITFFLEDYLNYGFNKISFVETLRNHGYHFYAAGRIYAFDLPHLPGLYKEGYAQLKAGKNYYMYSSYRKRLLKIAQNRSVLQLCRRNSTTTQVFM